MGLIKAGIGAVGGVLADQWKEFFYCDALPADVLVRKGSKRISGRSSNTKGSENIISNGSGIAVADGQCMLIVEQGRVVEVCAVPGEYTFDSSAEPSIFSGDLGDSIMDTFAAIGRRFGYGGDTGRDQRVYYINTKEIMGNKFGTPSPILFEVVNKRIGMSRTVNVRCNGVYSYRIADPLLFYTKVCGNVSYEFTRDALDEQLKAEFISALQPAFGALAELELRPAQLPAKVNELKKAMNDALKADWAENRGIAVENISLNPIRLSDDDMKKITDMEDAASYGANPFMMSGRMTQATANAMETAAGNASGAVHGFMGMNMVGGMNGGFGAAQQFYQMGVQQSQQQPQAAAPAPAKDGWKCSCGAENTGKFCAECGSPKPAEGWTCACGAVNRGKFCPECGAKKPAAAPLYRCDKCGWEPEDPKNPPKFCPECGDRFDDGDIR
ncbi:MAG: SPFH domain-containing protein [Oscillospiraceae bacterium]|nr:SPFH domain-containing protein [Oscillospiraceae bacterium]